jgi:hypothetical protein
MPHLAFSPLTLTFLFFKPSKGRLLPGFVPPASCRHSSPDGVTAPQFEIASPAIFLFVGHGQDRRPASEMTNSGAHFGEMSKSAEEISFDPKPLKEGGGWHIVVTYPGGMQEHIPGFQGEAEAEQWLSGKGRLTWLKARGYAQ